jgi:hypothetical protein
MVRPMSLRAVTLVLVAGPACLAGCADWPDLPDPPGVVGTAAPRISPLSNLPGPALAETEALDEETRRLQARADSLRARAAGIGVAP